ncbi:MAG TPA: transglutaminase domain-containing protein, partial [Verrucomicrobiae bacterium]|nr:transglutaminase domain-containing protein [Verrucomicrobiae bacterium]
FFILGIGIAFKWGRKWFRGRNSPAVREELGLARGLNTVAACLVGVAAALTLLNLVLTRFRPVEFPLAIARSWVIPARERSDFDFLVRHPMARNETIGSLLRNVELADLQRRWFYPNLPEPIYQEYLLSPWIDSRSPECNWRKTFWEDFQPQLQQEHDPMAAAQRVVDHLRARVGIDLISQSDGSVETTWILQRSDMNGFERTYVAALRSVGIASRLNPNGQVELWTGKEWVVAPAPHIYGVPGSAAIPSSEFGPARKSRAKEHPWQNSLTFAA